MISALSVAFATYLMQILGSLVLAIVLHRFYRLYGHNHLLQWSRSWWALCVYLSGAAIALYSAPRFAPVHPLRLIASSLTLTGGYWQIAFLLFGAYEVTTGKSITRRRRNWILTGLVFFSILITLAYFASPQGSGWRPFVLVGIRSLAAGLSYMGAAYLILRLGGWRVRLGRRFLLEALFVYGIEQFLYFVTNLLGLFDIMPGVYVFYLGFIDLLFQSLLGLGMVIWLLEEERELLLATSEALAASEEQLRQSQKMEAVGQLAGGIAHDFNNLLTVILGYSKLLLDDLPRDSPIRTPIEQIKSTSDRAAALTRQLLAFSRKQILAPRVLDLNSVVTNIEQMLRRLITENIRFVTNLAPDLRRVKVDPSQIEQVIVNLVTNARDAMPDGGLLTIETENVELTQVYSYNFATIDPGRYVTLTVSDTGQGMDMETQRRLFEPFFTTKEKGKGTGMGLSTVYGIIKQSGGQIEVVSEREKGATFRIYLPTIEQGEEAPVQHTAAHAGAGSSTILVVEEEQNIRDLICNALRKSGYTVLDAAHGQAALRLLDDREEPIHLLLTDVIMPGMSGRELADYLGNLRPSMKVIYMSGHNDDVILHHLVDTRAPFLQKPFAPDVLLSKVREVLRADSHS